ncbi:MAG: FGGY family carbohydrate kinase [Anaerolineales bacterium]
MSFIGIDLGGTFIKGAVLDVDLGQLRYIRRRPFPDFESIASFERVVSPQKVLKSFHELLDELLLLAPECDGVLLCGQMHALVFCDALGNPHSDIITWQDLRTGQPLKGLGRSSFDLLKEMLSDWDFRRLGNEFRAGLPLTQLFYWKQLGQLPEKLYPASLMDFVVSNLCKTPPVTDSTNAEAHGFFDVVDGCWDEQLIFHLGLDELVWQEVKDHGAVSGSFIHNGREIPCYVPVGDQQAALLGSFLQPRELSLNIATGSQVGLLSSECELGEYQTRPFFEGKFLKTITHIPAGRALNMLIRMFTEISPSHMNSDQVWNYIHSEVEKKQATDLEVSVAYYGGSSGSAGYITNMHEANMTLGDVFFAAFRGMAQNFHDCACRLSPSRDWDRIVFSGGLVSKMPALQRLILDKFDNAAFRMNELKEDTLTGLLLLAMKVRQPDEELAELSKRLQTGYNN